MASAGQTEMQGSHLCVLALTLLVVLIFGFVVMLSRVPVGIPGASMADEALAGNQYQFYSLLPEQSRTQSLAPSRAPSQALPVETAVASVTPESIAATSPSTTIAAPSVATPTLSARSVGTEPAPVYREIPANNITQEYLFFQVGNFRHAEDAERTRASMLLEGFEAVIVPADRTDRSKGHRVRLGPYFEPSRAQLAGQRLRQSGINYQLIRIQP